MSTLYKILIVVTALRINICTFLWVGLSGLNDFNALIIDTTAISEPIES